MSLRVASVVRRRVCLPKVGGVWCTEDAPHTTRSVFTAASIVPAFCGGSEFCATIVGISIVI